MKGSNKRITYGFLLLVMLAIALTDCYLYFIEGVKGVDSWTGIYTIEGLLLDAVGAIVVLAGDISFLRQRFIPTEKINRITDARFKLFDEEVLNVSEEGFDEIWPIIEDRTRIEEADTDDVVRLEVAESSQDRAVMMGQSKTVYPCVEKPDWTRKEYIENLPDGVEPKEYPPQQFDRLKSVGTSGLVDGWLDQEVRRMEQNAKQFPLRIGVLFFLAGFSVQGIAQIISLV